MPTAILTNERWAELAQEQHDVEIDGEPRISKGDDDGCYVQGWVWVGNPDDCVDCRFCTIPMDPTLAHRHDGGYVCQDCWDDRLKTTE